MLTRFEVHGFKNLLEFQADFGPLTCLVGPNGVGKSNLFDAIRFLSLLAERPIMEAALAVLGPEADAGNLPDLFWTNGQTRLDEIRLAAEMIVEPTVVDDSGREAQATSTFLRYELRLGYRAPERADQLGRLELRAEELTYIAEGEASKHVRFPHSAGRFRDAAVVNRRHAGSGYIATRSNDDGAVEILVHQDAGSTGAPVAHAASAPSTIVATSNTASTPTILAARREMQAWRIPATDALANDGLYGSLPAVVHRLTQAGREGAEERRRRLVRRLAHVFPIRDLTVEVDETGGRVDLRIHENRGANLPLRSLGDGALRFLALAVRREDPDGRGLLVLDPPESGIHPSHINAVAGLLQELAVDPYQAPGPENPLRQVLFATHSPVLAQLQEPADLLMARSEEVPGPGDSQVQALRCRPFQETWRDVDGNGLGRAAIVDFLRPLTAEQLKLAF